MLEQKSSPPITTCLDGDGSVDGEWCEGRDGGDEEGGAAHRANQQRAPDLNEGQNSPSACVGWTLKTVISEAVEGHVYPDLQL